MGERVTYVPARTEQRQTINLPPEAWQSAPPVVVVDSAFAGIKTTTEETTPISRSLALILRLLPFTVVWMVLALAVSILLNLGEIPGFIIFAVLTAVTYYALDRSERYDSATGVEHHRIDAAERLAMTKMTHDATLRREITAAYLKQLGGD